MEVQEEKWEEEDKKAPSAMTRCVQKDMRENLCFGLFLTTHTKTDKKTTIMFSSIGSEKEEKLSLSKLLCVCNQASAVKPSKL